MNERTSVWKVGDRVRFERFGEWLDGTVIAIRDGTIEYGSHHGVTHRWVASQNVHAAASLESLAPEGPKAYGW